MKNNFSFLLALAAMFTLTTARAHVKPNSLFSDNAVLQRGVSLPVWGTARVGKRLMAKGGELKGFVIAGADKKFVSAHAEIHGKTVVVTSSQVSRPVAVRHGWANVPDVNLYNEEGLPASPFRTDVN